MDDFRVGIGYDIHRLADQPGGSIALAGCLISCDRRLIAHSDGDVVLHAICDALLGATGAGDIGEWFPDHAEEHAGRDSSHFLANILASDALADWEPVNVDCNIIAQVPRLGPHKAAMRQRLASLLQLPPECVGLKARSNEGLDAIGRGEAIAAQAVVALRPKGSARASV